MPTDQKPPEDLPSENTDIAEEGAANRRGIEEVPEPGTDPLHEGP